MAFQGLFMAFLVSSVARRRTLHLRAGGLNRLANDDTGHWAETSRSVTAADTPRNAVSSCLTDLPLRHRPKVADNCSSLMGVVRVKRHVQLLL